MKKHLSIN